MSLFVPFIVRILLSLVLILTIHRRTGKLEPAIAAGTVLLAFWLGYGAADAARVAVDRALSPDNLFMVAVVTLVIVLSEAMSRTGMMRDLVAGVRARLPRKAAMAVLPALIGLLPMPGGALFSAPLVDDCDPERNVDPIVKVKANYWFRHVMETWWPLYPGVLIAVELSGIPVTRFIIVQFPVFLVSLAAGYLFILRRVPSSPFRTGDRSNPVLRPMLPTLSVVLVFVAIKLLIPSLAEYSGYLPIVIGLFVGLAVLQVQRPLPAPVWLRALFSGRTLSMIAVIVLIRIYGAFIELPLPDGTLLMERIRLELNAAGIPVAAFVMLLPFLSGLMTGLTVGFVGSSFPVVMSLLGPSPDPGVLLSTVVLAFGFGYAGMLLSPVHVCLIVTNRHFGTGLLQSILRLVLPTTAMLLGVVILSLLLRGTGV